MFDEELATKPKKGKPHPLDLQDKTVADEAHVAHKSGKVEKSQKMRAHEKRQARIEKGKASRNKLPPV